MSAKDATRQSRERETEGATCCSLEAAEGCPCAAAFKSHRVACTVVIAVVALAFLVSQVV